MVGGKGGECFHHTKKGAWSPPKNCEREGAEPLLSYPEFPIFTRWHCMGTCQSLYSRSLSSPNFFPPRFSCSNCIWNAPDRGKFFSNCLIWKGRRNQTLPLSFSSLPPSTRPLSLPLSPSLSFSPSPPPVTEHTCLILAVGVHKAISPRPAVLHIGSRPLWICGSSSTALQAPVRAGKISSP